MPHSIQIGSTEFNADLAKMNDAIGTVSRDRDTIRADFGKITSQFDTLHAAWQSPAGETYDEFRTTLQNAANTMLGVLDDLVSRMHTTYENYLNAETANANNLT